MRSFFTELRRRNVYRAGAAYAVAGWLVVQIATQVLPIFEVSPLVLRIIVLIIIAGFPLVLVLSWVYEVTPQGIVKTDEVAPNASITQRTGQRLNAVIIGTLAIAVLFLLAQRYLFPQRAAETKAPVSEKSIAVLPFDNLSDDKANAYFAEGIQDEILTRLAKVGALKVISRTSTQHYASKPDNLPEIARQLGVANILEGSVQKIGDAVHINVQLIRAATDDHLWAEIYNRKLDDIFGVQGEVAGAIALALNATLSGAEQAAVTDKPTQNAAAYDAYLRARALDGAGYSFDVARKQVDAYTEAVRLDPNFAAAWGNLAGVEGYLYFNGVDPQRYTLESIKHATDSALRLRPELGEAQIAQGGFRYRVLRDFAGAQQSFEAVLRQSPNNNLALQLLGLVERRQGHWGQALIHLQQAATLDPRNAGLMTTVQCRASESLDSPAPRRFYRTGRPQGVPHEPYSFGNVRPRLRSRAARNSRRIGNTARHRIVWIRCDGRRHERLRLHPFSADRLARAARGESQGRHVSRRRLFDGICDRRKRQLRRGGYDDGRRLADRFCRLHHRLGGQHRCGSDQRHHLRHHHRCEYPDDVILLD
jgi:TolB-like protein